MTAEMQIKAALTSLFDGISRADTAAILAGTEALDELLTAHRGGLHPQLRHFLEGRSYAKAAMFLNGESGIPAGVCGGGTAKRGPTATAVHSANTKARA